MSRWGQTGYAEPGLFPGANACRFRLTHVRDDGLVLMTVGDQQVRSGRTGPVFDGWYFMSLIGRLVRPGEVEIAHRQTWPTAADAEDGHAALLQEWENRE